MTQLDNPYRDRRRDWQTRVERLADQVTQWADRQGWEVVRTRRSISERLLGTYELPDLVIRRPGGEVQLEPVALHVVGGDGRVDLTGIPTLSRVKLIGAADGWTIMTDSNVPLRRPWTFETFVQLTDDLLA